MHDAATDSLPTAVDLPLHSLRSALPLTKDRHNNASATATLARMANTCCLLVKTAAHVIAFAADTGH